jgi:orotate phosphoribosyltransferase
MAELSAGQIELARDLYEVGAIQLKKEGEPGFKLKIHQTNPDAPLSPIFLNLRTPDNTTHSEGKLTADIVLRAGGEMLEVTQRADLTFDHVAGIPNAGVPFERGLRERAFSGPGPYSKVTLHKEGDLQSRRITGQVDGSYAEGDRVLLIDDLITKAGTKVEAVDALRGAGLTVEDLVVLVDREQGGVEEMRKAGVETHAVFTLTQLLDQYLEEGQISEETYREVNEYLQAS